MFLFGHSCQQIMPNVESQRYTCKSLTTRVANSIPTYVFCTIHTCFSSCLLLCGVYAIQIVSDLNGTAFHFHHTCCISDKPAVAGQREKEHKYPKRPGFEPGIRRSRDWRPITSTNALVSISSNSELYLHNHFGQRGICHFWNNVNWNSGTRIYGGLNSAGRQVQNADSPAKQVATMLKPLEKCRWTNNYSPVQFLVGRARHCSCFYRPRVLEHQEHVSLHCARFLNERKG